MQSDNLGHVLIELEAARDDIVESAGPTATWETKIKALDALRKICSSIMACEVRYIRDEILQYTDEMDCYVQAMVEVAQGMTHRVHVKEIRYYSTI